MSDSGEERTEGVEREALSRLEELVDRLLEDHAAISESAREADDRIQELETLLAKFTGDEVDATTLGETLEKLRDQNERLKKRIAEGREGVDRLLSRLRFLESQG